jgi:hypothetical protein
MLEIWHDFLRSKQGSSVNCDGGYCGSFRAYTMVVNSGALLALLIRNTCWHRRKRKRGDKTSLL